MKNALFGKQKIVNVVKTYKLEAIKKLCFVSTMFSTQQFIIPTILDYVHSNVWGHINKTSL